MKSRITFFTVFFASMFYSNLKLELSLSDQAKIIELAGKQTAPDKLIEEEKKYGIDNKNTYFYNLEKTLNTLGDFKNKDEVADAAQAINVVAQIIKKDAGSWWNCRQKIRSIMDTFKKIYKDNLNRKEEKLRLQDTECCICLEHKEKYVYPFECKNSWGGKIKDHHICKTCFKTLHKKNGNHPYTPTPTKCPLCRANLAHNYKELLKE